MIRFTILMIRIISTKVEFVAMKIDLIPINSDSNH